MKSKTWKRMYVCETMADARRAEKKFGKEDYAVAQVKVKGKKKNPYIVYKQ